MLFKPALQMSYNGLEIKFKMPLFIFKTHLRNQSKLTLLFFFVTNYNLNLPTYTQDPQEAKKPVVSVKKQATSTLDLFVSAMEKK